MEKIYIVKTTKGKWDSTQKITVAVCTHLWRAKRKINEWLEQVVAYENKYSKEEQEQLEQQWKDIVAVGVGLGESYPDYLLEYSQWVDNQEDFERFSDQITIEEVELNKILYTIE